MLHVVFGRDQRFEQQSAHPPLAKKQVCLVARRRQRVKFFDLNENQEGFIASEQEEKSM